MKTGKTAPGDAADLRRRAEIRLAENQAVTKLIHTEPNTRKLVHELQVHQCELEIQNEECLRTRAELEARYDELYDSAGVR